jgi:hypothetical protein
VRTLSSSFQQLKNEPTMPKQTLCECGELPESFVANWPTEKSVRQELEA